MGVSRSSNINFQNVTVAHIGGNYAVWFNESVTNSSITHSDLYDLGAGGVRIGSFSGIGDANEDDAKSITG